MTPPPIVGLDLDNTLVAYDDLFHALAVERGLPELEAELGLAKRPKRK